MGLGFSRRTEIEMRHFFHIICVHMNDEIRHPTFTLWYLCTIVLLYLDILDGEMIPFNNIMVFKCFSLVKVLLCKWENWEFFVPLFQILYRMRDEVHFFICLPCTHEVLFFFYYFHQWGWPFFYFSRILKKKSRMRVKWGRGRLKFPVNQLIFFVWP